MKRTAFAVRVPLCPIFLAIIYALTVVGDPSIISIATSWSFLNPSLIAIGINITTKPIILTKEAHNADLTLPPASLKSKAAPIASIPKGVVQVVQEGRQGTQEVTVKKTYKDETLVNEEQVSQKITKASINKIVEIGGGTGTSNYKVKVGDTLYVTSDRLSVMVEPDENSQKVATLSQNDELELKEIKDSWYKIESGTARGYVKAECTTYINPNAQNEEEYTNEGSSNEKSASTLKSTLSFNMALNKPSGLSLDQFKKVLTDSKDKNNIFANNAEYFYYIEKQYNINGIFVAAVGIHESGWGTSKISLEKKNLFGYGAYDSNPYNSAYHFSDYSESIDLLARVFVKYYLNPKGTSIYGGEVATGSYYNGATLTGVNTKYATDKNWANRVYQHMQYLYNKL